MFKGPTVYLIVLFHRGKLLHQGVALVMFMPSVTEHMGDLWNRVYAFYVVEDMQ